MMPHQTTVQLRGPWRPWLATAPLIIAITIALSAAVTPGEPPFQSAPPVPPPSARPSAPADVAPTAPERRWPAEEIALPFGDTEVHALAYDRFRQVMWLATPSEIGQFDGRETRPTDVPAPDVIIAGSILPVAEGLLVGARMGNNSAVWLHDGRSWKQLVETIAGSAFSLAPDAVGGVWIANSRFGRDSALRYYRGGRVTFVERGERLLDISAAKMDASGRLWLVMYGAVHAFQTRDGRLVDQVTIPKQPAGLEIVALEVSPSGAVLVGHRTGLMAITADGWAPLPVESLNLGAILALKFDSSQRLWVAGERGVAYHDGGAFHTPTGPRVIASEGWLPALELDEHGEMWVGSSAGLWRLRLDVEHRVLPGEFSQLFATHDALWAFGAAGLLRIDRASGAFAVAADGPTTKAAIGSVDRRSVWALIAPAGEEPGGLYQFASGQRVRMGDLPPGSLDDDPKLRGHPDGRGVFLMGRWGYDFMSWRDGRWNAETIEAPTVAGGTGIVDMTFDREGRLWAILPERIVCRENGQWIVSEPVESTRPVRLNLHGAAVASPDGGIVTYGPWRRLVRATLKEGRIVVTSMLEEGLQSRVPEQVPQMFQDGRTLWMASGGKLFRFEGGRAWTVDTAAEPWFPEFETVIKDDGRLWGLSRFGDSDGRRSSTLVSVPWDTAPTPRLSAAPGTALEAVVDQSHFALQYRASGWWWRPGSLSYRVTFEPAIPEFQEWSRDANVALTNEPHNMRRAVNVEAVDPLGRASAPLRFSRRVVLPIQQRPYFLPLATLATALIAAMIAIGSTVVIRRWRRHGYTNESLVLTPVDARQLEDLHEEVLALGMRPSLASLQQIGLRLGALVPAVLWRVRERRWQRDRRLLVQAESRDDEWVLALPWEAACVPSASRFLGQMSNVTIVRCRDEGRRVLPRPRRPTLLHLVASPGAGSGYSELGNGERAAIGAMLPGVQIIDVDTQGAEALTRDRLAALLATHPADILHLTCHGVRNHQDFEFLLSDGQGCVAPLRAARMIELLRHNIDRAGEGRAPFRLVALNVCQALGPRASRQARAFGFEVLEAGPDAVVGYLFEFGTESAHIFWQTFYGTWFRHGQVDHAAQRGRAAVRALRSQSLHDFASVAVYTANADGRACPP